MVLPYAMNGSFFLLRNADVKAQYHRQGGQCDFF